MNKLTADIAAVRLLNDRRTSGDWRVEHTQHKRTMLTEVVRDRIDGGFTTPICKVYRAGKCNHIAYRNDDEANAAFIAAAPLMMSIIERLVEEREWRPISEAPRDGTVVYVYNAKWSVTQHYVACWEDKLGCWCHAYRPLTPAPTHWKPLSTPPKGEA